MRELLRFPLVGLIAYGGLVAANVVRANDLALNEGAYGIEPLDVRLGSESLVRLVEEEVTIHFGMYESTVSVKFLFHNTSVDSPVYQLSGFPDIGLGNADSVEATHTDIFYMYDIPNTMAPLRNMRTYVNGKRVKSTLRYGFVAADSVSGYFLWVPSNPLEGRRVGWHTVPLTLALNGHLRLERRYRTTNGGDGLAGQNFFYITQTGGPWQGKISRLRAHVTLEDGLTIDDLGWECLSKEMEYLLLVRPPRAEWTILGPSRLELVWSDFEPMTDPGRDVILLVWRPEGFWGPLKSP